MSDTKIEAGDVVMLKSGGVMTVERMEAAPPHLKPSGDVMARCVWMDAQGAVQDRLFWPHLLVIDPKYTASKNADRVENEKRADELGAQAQARTDEAAKKAADDQPGASWPTSASAV